MKRKIIEGNLIVSLENEEVKHLCHPGAGADTCIWLTMGAEGWECLYFCRDVPNLLGETLRHRWETGKTVAKRDGCPEIEAMKDIELTKPQTVKITGEEGAINMVLPSEEEIDDWRRHSQEGEVCGIYGCQQKPTIKCPQCGNHYCEEHILVHFHEVGRRVCW